MRATLAAMWVLAACTTGGPYQSGDRAQLEFQLVTATDGYQPTGPIATGAATELVVRWPDIPNAREKHLVDVRSGDDALLPSAQVPFYVQLCRGQSEACFPYHDAQAGFELNPTRPGLLPLAFSENGNLIDSITLEFRDPVSLDVELSDQSGKPVSLDSAPTGGYPVYLRFILRDAQGAELIAGSGFTLDGLYTQTDGSFWTSSQTAGGQEFTVHYGTLSHEFVISFRD